MYSAPIIVVGTGRSGTSIVSGMLHYLGVNMGPDKDLIPGNRHNPAGHWEDSNFKRNNLLYIEKQIDDEQFEENTYRMYNKRATKNKFWGWKVPSTATLLPKYLELWEARQSEKPKIIWCKRPVEDVVDSMQTHYGWDDKHCNELIERRIKGIKQGLEEHEVDLMELSLDEIVKEDKRVIQDLISFIGIRPYPDEIERAEDLVTQNRPDENTKVYIGTPTLGRVRTELVHWYLAWSHDNRYRRKIELPMAIPYELNVNQIIEDFLESKADYLLLVDDDNPPVQDPLDLVELDKDIIGLPTPTWKGKVVNYNAMNKIGRSFQPLPRSERYGLKEVDAIGSGCMLIARRVLKDLGDNWFNPFWNEEGTSRRSGDFNFCTKARERGWKVWAHFDYPCEHIKQAPLKKIDDKANWDQLVISPDEL